MRGYGVVEDGFTFTEEEIARGSPRFWWGPRKRAAYDRVLARRGQSRQDERDDDREDSNGSSDTSSGNNASAGAAAGAAFVVMSQEEKRTESGSAWSSWFSGGSDGGSGSSDGSSSSGSSDSGGGSSDTGGSSSSE
ncbi:hypothetical protein GWK16_06940 [Roseomonas sp. JC162]|uniref:Uncharacterized protein n=1 Tax=Neoroseomonas marina TaxID=1232220 RepID=A0A848EBS0_9PROT|nr:hypothetical protein [Neoroseomonas marina]NMJ40969.1 hypothetical protein [Neoroseomonas marina]